MAKDAIAFLEAEHRQVESLFEQFNRVRDKDRQFDLVEKICGALKIHARLEEEIFYPAFLAVTGETQVHHEAEIEHAVSKNLIEQLELTSPREPCFPARMKVLAEVTEHHIRDEEKPGGMFAEARRSAMPLDEVGRALRARKLELEGVNPLLVGKPKSLLPDLARVGQAGLQVPELSLAYSDGPHRLRSRRRPSINR